MTCINDRMARVGASEFNSGFRAGKQAAWQKASKKIKAAYEKGLADGKKMRWVLTSEIKPDLSDLSKVVKVIYLVEDKGKRFWYKSQTPVSGFIHFPNLFTYWLDEDNTPLPELSQT